MIGKTKNLSHDSAAPPTFNVGATMHLGKKEQLTLETTAEFPSQYGRNVLKAQANAVKLADLADEGELSEQLIDTELFNSEIELDWEPENYEDTYKLRVAGTGNFYGFEGHLEFTITKNEVAIETPLSEVTLNSTAQADVTELRTEIIGTLSITKQKELATFGYFSG